MPIARYDKEFGGKKGAAAKAKASMVHQYGDEKGEQVFYATKNKRMKAKSHKPESSKDCGQMRQEESVKAGGFKDGSTVSAASAIPNKPFAKAR